MNIIKTIADHFEVLGMVATQDKELIKDSYKQAAKRSHPDAGGTQERFLEVQEAYKQCLEYADGKVKPSNRAEVTFITIWEDYMMNTKEPVKFSIEFASWLDQRIHTVNLQNLSQISALRERQARLRRDLDVEMEDPTMLQQMVNTHAETLINKIDASIAGLEAQIELNKDIWKAFAESYNRIVEEKSRSTPSLTYGFVTYSWTST